MKKHLIFVGLCLAMGACVAQARADLYLHDHGPGAVVIITDQHFDFEQVPSTAFEIKSLPVVDFHCVAVVPDAISVTPDFVISEIDYNFTQPTLNPVYGITSRCNDPPFT